MGGEFCDVERAGERSDLVASANWHALARFVATQIATDATLVDIGSTTTDIIRLSHGRVDTAARSDHQRLREGSLVYVGCRRTPVCALVDDLHFREQTCGVMNEVFATVDDARLVLGSVCEDAGDRDTADGSPRTRTDAANRLARMIGLDGRMISMDESQQLAAQVVAAARKRIHDALARIAPSGSIVLSGHGDDLIDLSGRPTVLRLADQIGGEMARCAPAYAVAFLAQKEKEAEFRCDVS
jgi:probable H4MPT-linked C1 transfer pathway protein